MLTYKYKITKLDKNEIFVFGSNPEGRHGKGSALFARKKFGAIYGKGRGIQGQSYALVTKNLKKGYYEESTGIYYKRYGYKSVSKEQITENIKELYKYAIDNPKLKLYIAYKANTANLNGYIDEEIAEMFLYAGDIPNNLVFEHDFSLLLQ